MVTFTFFYFKPEIPFLGKFGPKNQNCQVKLKFGTLDKFEYAKFNNDVDIFCFQLEIPFLDKFGPKNQIVSLS